MKNITFIIILSLLLSASCTAQTKKQKSTSVNAKETVAQEQKKVAMQEVIIETTMGNITIVLYNETPLHRDNFIKLANDKFYDGVLFHRIIQNFMIQAGDPDSKKATKGQRLGSGGPGYTIPAEILPQFSNKRGAVAAARLGDQANPERRSSGSQFYIVDNPNGATHLNGLYTVFGEVIKGLDVVDKIAAQPKDPSDRPLEDIKIISMKVVE
jgi:cyclophilin family peptidyl-prolyl cis-trans isomerase